MDVIVIMGAAVRSDGSPSGALSWRVTTALTLARDLADPVFLATGGCVGSQYAEAEVTRDLLVAAGTPPASVLVENQALTTLDSIVRCAAILARSADVRTVTICSDSYHVPRCRALFRLAGIKTKHPALPKRAHAQPAWRWWLRYVREWIATPIDGGLLLLRQLVGHSVEGQP